MTSYSSRLDKVNYFASGNTPLRTIPGSPGKLDGRERKRNRSTYLMYSYFFLKLFSKASAALGWIHGAFPGRGPAGDISTVIWLRVVMIVIRHSFTLIYIHRPLIAIDLFPTFSIIATSVVQFITRRAICLRRARGAALSGKPTHIRITYARIVYFTLRHTFRTCIRSFVQY